MTSPTKPSKLSSQNKVFIAIIVICLGIFLWFFIDTAQQPNALDTEEYVGIWGNYLIETDQETYEIDSYDEIGSTFIRIEENGDAELILNAGDSDFTSLQCYWEKAPGNEVGDADTGIIITDEIYNSPSFFHYYIPEGNDSGLLNKQLSDGRLAVTYGTRTLHYEKISNDPQDEPWNSSSNYSNDSSDSNDSSEENTQLGKSYSFKPNLTLPDEKLPDGAISWTEARQHVGERVTVCGEVKGSTYASTSNGRPTFLDIGEAYPNANGLTVTIWGENRDTYFPEDPRIMYDGQTICVTGEIYLYEGKCYMEVVSPSQIRTL